MIENNLSSVAVSIPEFCKMFGISRKAYYDMQASGAGPAELRMAQQIVRIEPEAIERWRRERAAQADTHRAGLRARAMRAAGRGR